MWGDEGGKSRLKPQKSPKSKVQSPNHSPPGSGLTLDFGLRTFWGNLPALNQFRMRVALAVVSGLLLALAFPKTGVAGFAWVAPGAMLAVAIGVNGRQAFRLGYVAGLAHYLTSLSWLLRIPVNKLAPISGWLALSGYLALYAASW